MKKVLKSFKPIVDENSRVLILGSMPGPEALRKQQYYGFEGNHFWHIIPTILGVERPSVYEDRIQLVRQRGIALWDVLASCVRPTALDSDIKDPVVNKIPALLRKNKGIKAIFINGKFAYNTFTKHFDNIDRPVVCLPSSSPANAAMTVAQKVKCWKAILSYLS